MGYLITHSLLSSWLYAMRENPFETAESEDPMVEFMKVLRREPTETTPAMYNGIMFEDLVTDILHGCGDQRNKWYDAADRVADIVFGSLLQFKASKHLEIDGRDIVLYGRLDCLKAGTIYDIKFSKSYDRGKYFGSTQHPTYLELIDTAERFVYVISNGNDVWTEEYRRDETKDIKPVIRDFFAWLKMKDLLSVYEEHWKSK